MRVNSSPSTSCTNSSSNFSSSDEGFQSPGECGAGDNKHGEESLPLEEEDEDDSYLNDSSLAAAADESIVSVEEDACARDETADEVPTLRRKRGAGRKGTKQGPRVTRNLTEEEVLSALQECCSQFSPWDFYDKVIDCAKWRSG
jgi:hypothetical protein